MMQPLRYASGRLSRVIINTLAIIGAVAAFAAFSPTFDACSLMR